MLTFALTLSGVITPPVLAADSATRRSTARHSTTDGDHDRTSSAPTAHARSKRSLKPPAKRTPAYANGAACELTPVVSRADRRPGAACELPVAAERGRTSERVQHDAPNRAARRSGHKPEKRRLTGVASFYGADFADRPTANGERFDPHAMTAAHRTLPFGTRVRVTNLENGRQVVVRINDRGPYRKGRVLDLSRAAARKLGFVEDGVAQVRIEVLKDKKKRRREHLTDDMQANAQSGGTTSIRTRL